MSPKNTPRTQVCLVCLVYLVSLVSLVCLVSIVSLVSAVSVVYLVYLVCLVYLVSVRESCDPFIAAVGNDYDWMGYSFFISTHLITKVINSSKSSRRVLNKPKTNSLSMDS